MNTLSVDTATVPHSIALSKEGKISLSILDQNTQSDLLFVEINSLLKQANIDYKNLDTILCTIGPGSFTGIRVGIAAIRGIKKIFRNIEINGFTTTEILAFLRNKKHAQNSNFYIILNAFGNEVYAQEFNTETKALSEIMILPKSHLLNTEQNVNLASNDTEIISFFKDHKIQIELISYNAAMLLEYYQHFPNNSSQVKPLYIKKPNIHHGAFRKKS